MRLSTIVLWLYAAIGAIANNEAAPGELQYLYALYKAEWVVHGKDGARTIATGCEHKAENWPTNSPTAITSNQRNQEDEDAFVAAAAALGVTGICAFDDFVKHIGVESTFTGWKYDRAGHSIASAVATMIPSSAPVLTYFQDPAWGGIKAKVNKAPVNDLPFRYDFTLLFPNAFTATQSEAWAEGIRLNKTHERLIL
ncbi:hypothetical protein BJ166DRAFT_573610 [Pestalotiopsis sp. NC0098]|nr:hypothetical protein BJ166DRAFT_573610 [Pestalotiopsis sp. NC0098]